MVLPVRLRWLRGLWPPMAIDATDSLPLWRDRLARLIFAYGAVAMPLAMVYIVPVYIARGRYALIALDAAVWLLLVGQLTFFRLPARYSRWLAVGALYAMTLAFLAALGPFGARPAWLMTCTVFCAALFGLPGAAAGALVNLSLLMGLHAFLGPESQEWSPVRAAPPGDWLIFVCNTTLLSLAGGMAVGFLLSRLDRSLRDQREAADTLRKRGGELESAYLQIRQEMAQRSAAEKALVDSEAQYRLLAENATDVIWTTDMALNLTYVSPSVVRTRGYRPEELLGQSPDKLMTAEAKAEAFRVLQEELAVEARADKDPGRSRKLELEFVRRDGSTFWSEVNLTFIRDGGGQAVGILGVSRDVSDRRQAQVALGESQARYRIAMEASPDPMVTYDMEGLATYINPAFTRVFGWEPEEVLGKTIDFVPGDERTQLQGMIAKVLAGESFSGVHTRRRTKSGAVVDVSLSAAVFRDQAGTPRGSVIALRDVTAQKRMELQLRQAQKLEAIGTLAGGIAHDFNNILAVIMGYAEIAAMDIPAHSRARDNLSQLLKASHRARDLVQQILAFSRQADQERKPMYLGPVVKETLKLIRASLPSSIRIRQRIETDIRPVEADPTQVHQVMMNLCANAAHAMAESGGVLEVVLAGVELDGTPGGRHAPLAPGRYLKLSVGDTGHGMGPETMDRIFDPYFTTKKKGEGTGLGLAVVDGIVKGHGGAILVESEPGKGSRFHVFLPAIQKLTGSLEEPAETDPRGTEHVLLVDDEPGLAEIGGKLLEQLGYRVTTRTGSIEALDLFRAQPERFDLVITDMTMPHMTGDRLAREMMRLRPGLPVILCTGFSRTMSAERAAELGIGAFLMKPVVRRDLARTVREVLDAGAGKESAT